MWTGDVVIVWGGASSDTGGRYSIVTVDDDHDGISDHCDNCAGTANSNQADADMDGFGDVCDCAPLDSGAFSFPEEVGGVQLAPDATTLTWLSSAPRAGSGTVHDVLRGILADLPVGGPSGVCLDSGDPGVTAEDPTAPAQGAGYYYLVRGRNACGTGTWGFRSNGSERVSSTCP